MRIFPLLIFSFIVLGLQTKKFGPTQVCNKIEHKTTLKNFNDNDKEDITMKADIEKVTEETETQIQTEIENENERQTETETQTEAEIEVQTETETEKETETQTETEVQTETETETNKEIETEAETEIAREIKKDIKMKMKPEIKKEIMKEKTIKEIERKALTGDKNPSAKDMHFWKEYNDKLQEGYLTMFDNIENEDRNLQAYHSGDQEVGSFQGFMDGVPVLRNMLGKTCFPDIGCFSAMDYQDMSKRPIPVLPLSPQYMDVKFHLYTLSSDSIPTNLSYNTNSSELLKTSFNPMFRTILIIHGFRSGLEPWMEQMRDFLFHGNQELGEYNIVLVNWEKGSKVPMYHLAAMNTRVVGALVAFFINRIADTFKISNDQFYLIGHSLGGHTCGYAGKRLHNPKLSRISALDPAGPGFHFDDPKMRLHPSDATQVDVIHTDCGGFVTEGLGTFKNFGYYDFYPNGGILQPGCPSSSGVVNLVSAALSGEEISCSHTRAYALAATMGKPNQECFPMAYQCLDWETFLEGRCGSCGDDESKCRLMGLYPSYWKGITSSNNTLNKKYFINTAANEEFCLYHYQIALHVSNDSEPCTGRIIFSLSTPSHSKPLIFDRIMTRLNPGSIHTLLVVSSFSFNKVKKAGIEWKRWIEGERLQRGRKLIIPFIEINHLSHFNKIDRDLNSVVLCPKSDPEVIATRSSEAGEKSQYIECLTPLQESARNLKSDFLKPLTVKEDIISVDYDSKEKIHHKFLKSNFRVNLADNKPKKNVTVKNFFGIG